MVPWGATKSTEDIARLRVLEIRHEPVPHALVPGDWKHGSEKV
jgi:hypothetical protein